MKRILATLAVLALFTSPVLAQTDGTGTTGTDPNTGTTGTTGTGTTGTTDPNTGTTGTTGTTNMNEADRTTGTAGERGVGTGSGEPMQYGDQPYNTGPAGNGSLPATASPLPPLVLIGAGSLMLGLMATRRNRGRS